MRTNSDNINLDSWRMTLPVDKEGKTSGKALTVKDLKGFEHSKFFYDAPDGAMVFRAPVEGARTSKNTKYTRTELREEDGMGERAAWTIKEGGIMTATLKIDEAPVKNDGDDGRIIVGQIHGSDDELVRLYYEDKEVYYMNEHSKADGKEHRFDLKNKKGETPNVDEGELFSYKIEVKNERLLVEVGADGDIYASNTKIHPFWDTDTFYFKAGLYMGVNGKSGDGWGQVSFYDLELNGNGSQPTKAADDEVKGGAGDDELSEPVVIPVVPEVVREESPEPPYSADKTVSYVDSFGGVRVDLLDASKNTGSAKGVLHEDVTGIEGSRYTDRIKGDNAKNEIAGGANKDYLFGRGGEDLLEGGLGNDRLDGGAGRDVLVGGAGKDIFIFDNRDDSVTDGHYDEIADFERGHDTIDLRKLGFSGFDTDGYNTDNGELRLAYSEDSNRTYVRSDQDDFEFYFNGDYTDLTTDDFLF